MTSSNNCVLCKCSLVWSWIYDRFAWGWQGNIVNHCADRRAGDRPTARAAVAAATADRNRKGHSWRNHHCFSCRETTMVHTTSCWSDCRHFWWELWWVTLKSTLKHRFIEGRKERYFQICRILKQNKSNNIWNEYLIKKNYISGQLYNGHFLIT